MAAGNPWREEFERDGERQVYDNFKQGAIYNSEEKRAAALQWLRDKESERDQRDKATLRYVRWTLVAAILAVVVSVIFGLATIFIPLTQD
jgi:ABC-type sugar transport system permease subunit